MLFGPDMFLTVYHCCQCAWKHCYMLLNPSQSNSSPFFKLPGRVISDIGPPCWILLATHANSPKLNNTNWCLPEGTCIFFIWVDLACRCTCFANLALISVDRFVATKYPLKYHRIITKRGGQLMLVYIWFHGVVIASLGLHNWSNPVIPAFAIDNPLGCRKTTDPAFYTFVTCVGFFAPLLIIAGSYSHVFSISCQHWKTSSRRVIPESPSLVQGDVASKRSALTREIKAAKTLAIVIPVQICCWLPFFIILMTVFWCATCVTEIRP